jgi:hypothetical protein
MIVKNYPRFLSWLKIESKLYQIAFKKGICYRSRIMSDNFLYKPLAADK